MREIRWHLKKHPINRTCQIVIEECPKCGKEGTLVKAGDGSYRIVHKDDRYSNIGCRFGKNSEYSEQLTEIWTKVRSKRKLRC